MVKRLLRLSLLLLALLSVRAGAAPAEAFPGLNRKWTHYQSPNFELYSCRNEAISREILERMELLRAVFLDTFKLPVRMPQPVTLYCFSSEKDFKGYMPANRRGVSYDGFCLAHPDRTVITLAPTWSGETGGEVVYHEYIHCLMHMAEENPLPWYNEGVAELFSSVTADQKWVTFGNPLPGRVYTLQQRKLMSLGKLFTVTYDDPLWRSEDGTSLLYAESWILLHYLFFGENQIPAPKSSLFLRAASTQLAQKQPEEFRAFTRETLGTDYPGLEAQLDRYIRSGRFMGRKVLRPTIAAPKSYAMRAVGAEEMTLRLAELALRYTDSGYANLTIRNEVQRQPDARLNEVLGAMAQQAGELDVARERWLAAVELGSQNVAVYRELGRLESNLVFGQFNLDYRLPEERAARLRLLIGKSLEAAPAQITGYEMLAWVEATAQKPDVTSVIRVQKEFNRLNDKPRTLLALVMVRMRLGQTKEALALLDDMNKLQPNDWALFCAELTRARLENRPVDETKLPPSNGRRVGNLVIMPPKMELKPPH